jgi:nitrogen regulatory protein P-II 1
MRELAMKKIEAIIRPEKLNLLRETLDKSGFPGMTVVEVKGRGRQKGIALQWRAGDYRVEFLPKVKLEIVVEDEDSETVIDLICDTVRTGDVGDGKIFVYPVEDVVRVRTKERGCSAV